ncbi:MAG: DUF1868 domain-containing protein [Tatlockia sp.]|nr:DUF1868 domain-containing protein [Tatlockia sp.]
MIEKNTNKFNVLVKNELEKISIFRPVPKYNKQGQYTQFRGFTVVASIYQQDKEKWRQFYDFINELDDIKQCFTLLPPESYHMTLYDLYSENETSTWKPFIADKLNQIMDLKEPIEAADIKPKAIVDKVAATKVLVVDLKIKEESETAILSLAEQLSLQRHLPKHGFHLTLGYKYKEASAISTDTLNMLAEKLNELFEEINFDSAKLCYFHDMKRFIPWDGVSNPWEYNPEFLNENEEEFRPKF